MLSLRRSGGAEGSKAHLDALGKSASALVEQIIGSIVPEVSRDHRVKSIPGPLLFAALLHEKDAQRASQVVATVLAHGLRCALTGGLAIAAHLQINQRPV